MPRFSFLLLLLLAGSVTAFAQPDTILAMARNMPARELRINLQSLASPVMEGRRMGTHGDSMAARFVARWFAASHLAPAIGQEYFQTITASRLTSTEKLTIGGDTYGDTAGWNLYPHPQSHSWNGVAVIYTGNDTSLHFMDALAGMDLKNKLVLIPRELYRARRYAEIDSVEAILRQHGARGAVWTDPQLAATIRRRNARAFLPRYDVPTDKSRADANAFPELALVPELMQSLLKKEQGLSISSDGLFSGSRAAQAFELATSLDLSITTSRQAESAPNVLGIVRGYSPSSSCIVVSAHRDHDGKNGKDIYFGAVDNASGSAAMMELARMMQDAASKGFRPKRSIVFASFTGEERGLLGSSWYVEHPAVPLEKTFAVFNLDMLGRVDSFYKNRRADSNYVYVQVSDGAKRGLRAAVDSANARLGQLHIDNRYEQPPFSQRSLTGSDHYPFHLKGIPFVYFQTGFCEDYHMPTDTAKRINYDLLLKQTQLAFLTLWNLANSD